MGHWFKSYYYDGCYCVGKGMAKLDPYTLVKTM